MAERAPSPTTPRAASDLDDDDHFHDAAEETAPALASVSAPPKPNAAAASAAALQPAHSANGNGAHAAATAVAEDASKQANGVATSGSQSNGYANGHGNGTEAHATGANSTNGGKGDGKRAGNAAVFHTNGAGNVAQTAAQEAEPQARRKPAFADPEDLRQQAERASHAFGSQLDALPSFDRKADAKLRDSGFGVAAVDENERMSLDNLSDHVVSKIYMRGVRDFSGAQGAFSLCMSVAG